MIFIVFSCNITYIKDFFVRYKNATLKKIKTKQKLLDVMNYFIELLLYYKYIETPKIKRLKNIDLLSELPFYE